MDFSRLWYQFGGERSAIHITLMNSSSSFSLTTTPDVDPKIASEVPFPTPVEVASSVVPKKEKRKHGQSETTVARTPSVSARSLQKQQAHPWLKKIDTFLNKSMPVQYGSLVQSIADHMRHWYSSAFFCAFLDFASNTTACDLLGIQRGMLLSSGLAYALHRRTITHEQQTHNMLVVCSNAFATLTPSELYVMNMAAQTAVIWEFPSDPERIYGNLVPVLEYLVFASHCAIGSVLLSEKTVNDAMLLEIVTFLKASAIPSRRLILKKEPTPILTVHEFSSLYTWERKIQSSIMYFSCALSEHYRGAHGSNPHVLGHNPDLWEKLRTLGTESFLSHKDSSVWEFTSSTVNRPGLPTQVSPFDFAPQSGHDDGESLPGSLPSIDIPIQSDPNSLFALPGNMNKLVRELSSLVNRASSMPVSHDELGDLITRSVTNPILDKMAPTIEHAEKAATKTAEITEFVGDTMQDLRKVIAGIHLVAPIVIPLFVFYFSVNTMWRSSRTTRVLFGIVCAAASYYGYGELVAETERVIANREEPEPQSFEGVTSSATKLMVTILASHGFATSSSGITSMLIRYAGVSKGIDQISADVLSLFGELCLTCEEYLPFDIASKFSSKDVMEWVECARRFNVEYQAKTLAPTLATRDRLNFLIDRGIKIITTKTPTGGMDLAVARNYVAKLQSLQDTLLKIVGSTNVSFRATVLYLFGSPGCGKTQTCDALETHIIEYVLRDDEQALAIYRERPEFFSYNRGADKWWEGVNPYTKSVIFDDFGQETFARGQQPNPFSRANGE